MQIAISIEPYLVVEKVKLIQYIENIVQIGRELNQNGQKNVCLHFDYFKSNPEVFDLVQSYSDQIDMDLHLMQEFAPSVEKFRSVSFDIVDWRKDFQQVKGQATLLGANMRAVEPTRQGLVLDLGCDICGCEDLIRSASYIIIMTVKCGKSGQTFQPSALQLIPQVRRLNPDVTIIIDGGVNESNISLLKEAGVDVAVVGNYAKKCYENGELLIGINRLLRS